MSVEVHPDPTFTQGRSGPHPFGLDERRLVERGDEDMVLEGLDVRAPMLGRLEAIFHEHARDGTVEIRYDVEVYSGRPSNGEAA